MSLHRIAVISDTHGILRPEVEKILSDAELILHGGDITSQSVLDRLNRIAEVIAVRGNGDKEWAGDLPEEQFFERYGKKIYMIHNKKQISEMAENADIIIYGHSHKYEERTENGKLWLNPGSCGPRRLNRPLTMAMLKLDTGTGDVKAERLELTAAGRQREDTPAADLSDAVTAAVSDLKRGKSLDEIVKARGIKRELAEQICQIYFTHPGIDVQGVLNKMEIAGR